MNVRCECCWCVERRASYVAVVEAIDAGKDVTVEVMLLALSEAA